MMSKINGFKINNKLEVGRWMREKLTNFNYRI